MSEQLARRFMDALQESERKKDPGIVTALFSSDAEASSLARKHPARGHDQIRRFWSEYLALFEQIASEFTSTVINDAGGALEWRSRGRLRNGQDIDYRGVSILEMRNDEVIAFRTYFDTAVFTPHGAKLAASR